MSVAICFCGAPLVWTFAFPHKEYYCLDCGATWGAFDTSTAAETPELVADREKREAEFEPIAKALLVARSKLDGCEKCWGPGSTDHPEHATDEERAADVAAREWLVERRTVAA